MWNLVITLHLLAMALFVGGQLFLGIAVVPVERRAPDRERLRAIARRFGYASVGAFAVLIATGSALAAHYHRWGEATLQVKLGLVAVVVLLVLWHLRRPQSHLLDAAILSLSLVIVWLGVRVAG
jgi:uncharacterized membrane protein